MFKSTIFFFFKLKIFPHTECYIKGKRLGVFHFLWWLTITCVHHTAILCLAFNEVTVLRVGVNIFKSKTAGQSVIPVEAELLPKKCTGNSQHSK